MKIPGMKKETPRTAIDERVPVVPTSEKVGGAEMAKCPYCQGTDFVKRGKREKKHETIQLYLCRAPECGRTFSDEASKGRRYPMKIVIEGMSYYNLGFSLEATCSILKKKFGAAPESNTLSEWVETYKPLCRYERMRPYAIKMYSPTDVMECVTHAHRQLYHFRYHRAKMRLLLEEYKNRRFDRVKEFLDNVSSETPHQFFTEGNRMSEVRSKFDKTEMIVKSKTNFANKLTAFALQGAGANKLRHEAVQRFMIANDSVTVATEVPVYIKRQDIEHMEKDLNFQIVGEEGLILKGAKKQASEFPELLTGHIDLLQVRNGIVHILDYKPNAAKEKPIEQLTWYALALSRMTGLRLFEFKCAWFDEKDFFEFYPLHVVKKLQRKKSKRISFKDGTKAMIPTNDEVVIV